MTGDREDRSATESWVRGHRTTYPYAFDGRNKFSDWFGVTSIPFAVLVDPDGIVVWKGHPARIPETAIAAALTYAVGEPISGWPKETLPLQLLLKQGQYAKAMSLATQLGEPYLTFVKDRVSAKIEAVQRAHDAGDYLTATGLGDRAIKELAGLREAMGVKSLVDSMRRDPLVRRVLDAQERIGKYARELQRMKHPSEEEKVRSQLRELVQSFENTYAAAQARSLLAELDRRALAR